MAITDTIANIISSLVNSVPENYKILITLFIYTFSIAVYGLFIWKFYKFIASKDIIQINLSQYNYSKHPFLEKFLAVVLYTIEYLILLPFLVIFWFIVLSLFLLILSDQAAQQILLVSTAIISSTRITAYISEDLSKDIAKILPFTVLALFMLGEKFFDMNVLIARIQEIPLLFENVLLFLIFIFLVEFVLRGLYSFSQLFSSS